MKLRFSGASLEDPSLSPGVCNYEAFFADMGPEFQILGPPTIQEGKCP